MFYAQSTGTVSVRATKTGSNTTLRGMTQDKERWQTRQVEHDKANTTGHHQTPTEARERSQHKTKHGSEEKKTRQTRRNTARHNKTRDTTAPDKKKHESEDKKKDTANKTRDKTTARQIRRNRRFPEITSKDNLTVFSYSGRVKSPKWRWQRRSADL